MGSFEVVQVDESGASVVVASGLDQASAERFAAARSRFRDCWGCVVRETGSDTWALCYKLGWLNDANVDPVAVGWEAPCGEPGLVQQTGMERLLAAVDALAEAKELWESGELSYREYRAAWERVHEARDAAGAHDLRLRLLD